MLGLAGVTDMEAILVEATAADASPELVPLPPPHPTKIRKTTSGRTENKSFALLIHIL
jgi:hypothetical protein